jgi:hypothetical protein
LYYLPFILAKKRKEGKEKKNGDIRKCIIKKDSRKLNSYCGKTLDLSHNSSVDGYSEKKNAFLIGQRICSIRKASSLFTYTYQKKNAINIASNALSLYRFISCAAYLMA